MKLSLSVRIAEAPCKSKLNLRFEELVAIAKSAGYDAVCMRASAGGIFTPAPRLDEMSQQVRAAGLSVSMVTADFEVPRNQSRGPESLREIGPSLDVAEAFGCDLIRVCLKLAEDIPYARNAADRAAERGIRLAHQCHTSSLFEEVDPILDVLSRIQRANFGVIYEPANLMICGQSYALDTLKKLKPHLMNVYVQNHRLDPAGPDTLPTYCCGDVRYHRLDPWKAGGIDFDVVFNSLHAIGYDGYFTIHQAQGIHTEADAKDFATRCSDFARARL